MGRALLTLLTRAMGLLGHLHSPFAALAGENISSLSAFHSVMLRPASAGNGRKWETIVWRRGGVLNAMRMIRAHATVGPDRLVDPVRVVPTSASTAEVRSALGDALGRPAGVLLENDRHAQSSWQG